MTSQPIKVLIVDDSPSASELLAYMINSDSHLKVIGIAESGEQALEFLKKETPDVITMDIYMPKIDGFETTRRIMQTKPIPIIIISASYNRENVAQSFRAIEAGALAILEKPKGLFDAGYKQSEKEIISSLKTVAGIKLITRKASAPLPESAEQSPLSSLQQTIPTKIEAVAIGASLGGPQALKAIITNLGPYCPVPIFIVQHISPGFTEGFVDWLAEGTSISIKIAEHQEIAVANRIYMAPDYYHMEVRNRHKICLINDPLDKGLKPSVSRLFSSVAETYGKQAIGVILTGMGRDGADGLLEMKQKGAITIAQDQASCLIYGMPKEAFAIGAVRHVLPLSQIPDTLKFLLKMNGQ